MKLIDLSRVAILALSLVAFAPGALAQAVVVTLGLDSPSIAAGQATTLRVFAQVAPAMQATSDRIFSWYVDIGNTNGVVAVANYAAMVRATSDNEPQLSSSGTADGAHRRGVYDFFINRPGAGVSAPVELMRIPVTGQTAGRTRFVVTAGSGVAGFSSDFLVLPLAEGAPASGGNYTAAFADLVVSGTGECAPALQITRLTGDGGPGGTLQLTFTPCAGRTHVVEYRARFEPGEVWTALPGGPHDSGSVIVSNSGGSGYFRVRTTGP